MGRPEDTRILANISNTTSPIVKGATALSTTVRSTLILTPVNYAGPVGVDIGSQIPTDLTMPDEAAPGAPALNSRRIYVDSGAADDLSVERSDSSTVDLESILLNYQKSAAAIMGNGANQNVYTFSVPSIPAGKGIRVRVFWKCTTCTLGGSKTFSWQFGGTGGTGGTTTAYGSYTGTLNFLSYTEVRIFNNPGVQNSQTMFGDPITVGTGATAVGTVSFPAQTTSSSQSVTFLFNAPSSETITPMGFIVEKI